MRLKLTKEQRQELRVKFGGYCAYCGCSLGDRFHADHVKAVYRFGDDLQKPKNDAIENLFPSCAPCNNFKATFTIEEFRKEIENQVQRAQKYSINYRTAQRFGLVKVTNDPVVFWFERFGKLK